jgi:hypothetical protein
MEEIIKIFIKHFKKTWIKNIGTENIPNYEDFLILTASNNEKESYHLHGPFNNTYFHTVLSLKKFILLVLTSINEDEEDKKNFLINKPKDVVSVPIDMEIYGDTSLRMYGNTKKEKYRYKLLLILLKKI